MINYKNAAIKAFKKGNFNLAVTLFSLAYEKSPQEETLFLINLSQSAKKSPEEALILFEHFYSLNSKKHSLSELNDILKVIETQDKGKIPEILLSKNVISYEDFMDLVDKKGDFGDTFENIMFSTKVLISNREDMIEFVDNLFLHGYKDIGLSYLEMAAQLFSGDEKLDKISERAYENRD